MFHLGNLLLHILNILLIYWLVQLITKNNYASVLTAAFFALHPMHVESVAWVAERKDVLYSFFFLATLISYIYYIKTNCKYKFLIIAIITFILSLLSKFAAVTLPLILILIDYYYNRPLNLKVITEKIPFFILALALGIIHFSTKDAQLSTQVITENFTALDRIFLGSYSLFYYFMSVLFPFKICPLHPYPDKINGILPVYYYASFVFVILLIIIAFVLILKSKKIKKDLIFGLLFFLINIALVIHIVPFGGWVVVADRYSYIAYFGLFFIIGKLWILINENYFNPAKKIKNIFNTLIIISLLIFSYSTYSYSLNWKNSNTFWNLVIDHYPSNSCSAIAYYGRGISEGEEKNYKDAFDDYNMAIKLKPNFPDAYNNRGKIRQDLKDYEGSIVDFNKAISLDPNFTKAYHNRGYTYYFLQKYDKAMLDYNKAVKLDPFYYEAYDNRGIVKFLLNDFKGAIEDYNKAILLKPDFAEAYNNRGGANYYLKDFKTAENDYSKAIQLKPDFLDAYKNRCFTRLELNDIQGACNDYNIAKSLGYNEENETIKKYCK